MRTGPFYHVLPLCNKHVLLCCPTHLHNHSPSAGEGVPLRVDLANPQHSTIAFGSVSRCSTATRTVTLANRGKAAVLVSLAPTRDTFMQLGIDATPPGQSLLRPRDTMDFTLVYRYVPEEMAPPDVGKKAAVLWLFCMVSLTKGRKGRPIYKLHPSCAMLVLIHRNSLKYDFPNDHGDYRSLVPSAGLHTMLFYHVTHMLLKLLHHV